MDAPEIPETKEAAEEPPAAAKSDAPERLDAPKDQLLAVIGNRELREADSPLALSAPRDDDTCMQYSHEDGHARNKPVAITYGSGSATLFQGETAALDGLSVSVVAAQSNNRSHPWAPCRGELCPWEKLAWYAIDADLEPVPPL